MGQFVNFKKFSGQIIIFEKNLGANLQFFENSRD